jgi:hypothetical protein
MEGTRRSPLSSAGQHPLQAQSDIEPPESHYNQAKEVAYVTSKPTKLHLLSLQHSMNRKSSRKTRAQSG